MVFHASQCGHEPPSARDCNLSQPRPGDVVGNRFQVLKKLGSGGFNYVYTAVDLHKKYRDVVAIKIPRCYQKEGHGRAGPEMIYALKAGSHTHVGRKNVLIPLETFYRRDMRDCVVMPKMKMSLADIEWKALTTGTIIWYYGELIAGLHYLHESCFIVHCDIKCENILIDSRGIVKFADFSGKQLRSRDQFFSIRGVISDIHYQAPEFLTHGDELSHRSDVWSLGIVFFRLWNCGRLPFRLRYIESRREKLDKMRRFRVHGSMDYRPTYKTFSTSHAESMISQMMNMDHLMRCSARHLARLMNFTRDELE